MYSCSCMVDQWSSYVCRHYLPEVRCFPVELTEVKANLDHYFILPFTLHHNGLNVLECTSSDTNSLQQRQVCQLQVLVIRKCELTNINATQICTIRHPQSSTTIMHSTSHDNHSLQYLQSIQFHRWYSMQRIDSDCQILQGLLLFQYQILLCYLKVRYPNILHIIRYSLQFCLTPNHDAW